MTVATFLMFLTLFTAITGLITEGVKKIMIDPKPNLIAIVTALIVGVGGLYIYYIMNHILITSDQVVFMILMGLSSALTAMVGYDKVAQLIEQFTGGAE